MPVRLVHQLLPSELLEGAHEREGLLAHLVRVRVRAGARARARARARLRMARARVRMARVRPRGAPRARCPPLHLPYISPTSPLHLPYISPDLEPGAGHLGLHGPRHRPPPAAAREDGRDIAEM